MTSIGFTFAPVMGAVGYRGSNPRAGFMPLSGGYAPGVSNRFPGASIVYTSTIGFNIDVAPGFAVSNVVVQVVLPSGAREVAYSNGAYVTGYSGSTTTLNNGVTNVGTQFRFTRAAGFFDGSWSVVVAAKGSDSSSSFEQSMSFTAAVGGSGVELSTGLSNVFTNIVSAAAGNRTLNLPTAVGISGYTYRFKRIDSTGNTFTLDGNGSETIGGSATRTMASLESLTIQSNGSNWIVI